MTSITPPVTFIVIRPRSLWGNAAGQSPAFTLNVTLNMTDFEAAVKSILLPTESIKVVLETLTEPSLGPSVPNDDVSPILVQKDDKRILAVVSHIRISQSNEQGW
jgi:hypothetical protein